MRGQFVILIGAVFLVPKAHAVTSPKFREVSRLSRTVNLKGQITNRQTDGRSNSLSDRAAAQHAEVLSQLKSQQKARSDAADKALGVKVFMSAKEIHLAHRQQSKPGQTRTQKTVAGRVSESAGSAGRQTVAASRKSDGAGRASDRGPASVSPSRNERSQFRSPGKLNSGRRDGSSNR